MGGMIAQEFVLNYPERVEKLVLCSCNCGGSKAVWPSPEVIEFLSSDKTGLTPEERVRELIPYLYTKEFIKENPDYIEEAIQTILKNLTPENTYQRQLDAGMKYIAGRRLKKVNTPTLIVQGKKDLLIPPKNAEVLAKLIHDSRVALFDNSGHAVFSQETEIVARTILEFLK